MRTGWCVKERERPVFITPELDCDVQIIYWRRIVSIRVRMSMRTSNDNERKRGVRGAIIRRGRMWV